MKIPKKRYLIALVITITAAISFQNIANEKARIHNSETKVAGNQDEQALAFHTMMDVLTHQRCVNCHPNDNIPKQGEDRHPHRFDISRANSTGATNCNTCHQSTNNDYSGVPGAPEWSLAPPEMAWEGLDRYEIARMMLDKSKNGNRSHEDLMHHLTEHELVLWAWNPGIDAAGNPRELPPVSKENYIKAVKEWIDNGAVIPTKADQ
jgi:hypothetical protein